jgi:hypothetical protein
VQVAFLWAALFAIYKSARLYVPDELAFSAPFIASLSMIWGFMSVHATMPYDMPAVFFAAAGTWAVLTRNFPVVLLCVSVGTLNKETNVWLIPAYLFACSRKGDRFDRRLLARVGLLCLAYAAAYAFARFVTYRGETLLEVLPTTAPNTEFGRRSRILTNLDCLLLRYPGDRFHRLTQNVYWVLSIHAPALLLWRRLPRDLKAAYLATPFLLLPLMVVGQIYEFRLFNELIPLGAVAMLAVLAGPLFGIEPKPQPAANKG